MREWIAKSGEVDANLAELRTDAPRKMLVSLHVGGAVPIVRRGQNIRTLGLLVSKGLVKVTETGRRRALAFPHEPRAMVRPHDRASRVGAFEMMRGQNTGAPAGTRVAVVKSADEMDALDRLGPRARLAIANAPIKLLAAQIDADVRAAGLNPLHPQVDEAVERGIRDCCVREIAKDRDDVDACGSIVPLVAKRTRRSRL